MVYNTRPWKKKMLNIPKTVCLQFRDARCAIGLTQAALAAELGFQQPALSMFEKGMATKLSDEYVAKLAARLNLDLDKMLEQAKAAENFYLSAGDTVGFCPDPLCPSNTVYSVGERTFYRISFQKGRYCAHCGEVLERLCSSCGAQLNEGACCSMCGKPYIHPPIK